MPATSNAPAGGTYLLQFGLDFNSPNPGPWYLTSHGEGKQLTIEHLSSNNQHNQEWNIQPITGKNPDIPETPYRTIAPALSPEIPAVSQDVVRFPDQVSLIKNLQVWTFVKIRPSESIFEIRSNLYTDVVEVVDPLLGVDLQSKDLNVIIQKIPVIHVPPRPVWSLIPVNSKK